MWFAHIVKNERNSVKNPKYKYKVCGFGGVFQTLRESEEFKKNVIKTGQERASSRGLGRAFDMRHQTALNGIASFTNFYAQNLPARSITLFIAKTTFYK